jgi:protein-disulfide isomerase
VRIPVKKHVLLFAVLGSSLFQGGARGQQSQSATAAPAATGAASATQKNIEAYLRNLYAFGQNVELTVSAPKETAVEGMLETTINVVIEGNKQSATFYVSKDGRYLFRGEMSDLSKDPLAANRALIQMNDTPSLGADKAPVTLVEYSDFECPICRSLHDVLRGLLPKYAGRLRVVFKDFPLEQLHPWARTAAIAGRCAYQQNPQAFWSMYDLIYDNQDIISPGNAWTKMNEYADQNGLNGEAFKRCMAGPEAGAAVDASHANGEQLDVNSTPTVFVNGRRLVGADQRSLERYIDYELAQQKTPKSTEKN